MVSLSRNSIKLLNRTWFSPDLPDLFSLDLSYNKIVSLPQDFFVGMNALRKLRLDNNKLMSLPFDTIKNIWNKQLIEFTIESKSNE